MKINYFSGRFAFDKKDKSKKEPIGKTPDYCAIMI